MKERQNLEWKETWRDEIIVEPYPYPISYKGEYHYRSGATKQELKGAALDRFLLRKNGKTWDGVPLPGVSPRALAGTTIATFRKRARQSKRLDASVLREPVASLLEKLHLTEGRYLKRAFVNKTTDLLLTKYLRAGISYQGLLYPDKLMLWNPGHLPQDWSIAKLEGKHPSVPPNPDIANAFFRAGMIEAWGRGIQKIKDACRTEGAPMPSLRLDDGLWIEFTFAAENGNPAGKPTRVETRVQTRVETRVQTRVQTRVETKRGSTESALIEMLREQPTASLAEAAGHLGRAVSTVERASAKLIAAGRLKFVGPKKAGRWKILS